MTLLSTTGCRFGSRMRIARSDSWLLYALATRWNWRAAVGAFALLCCGACSSLPHQARTDGVRYQFDLADFADREADAARSRLLAHAGQTGEVNEAEMRATVRAARSNARHWMMGHELLVSLLADGRAEIAAKGFPEYPGSKSLGACRWHRTNGGAIRLVGCRLANMNGPRHSDPLFAYATLERDSASGCFLLTTNVSLTPAGFTLPMRRVVCLHRRCCPFASPTCGSRCPPLVKTRGCIPTTTFASP